MACAFAFAFVLASGEQGFDCSPLAGLRPGRVGTRALAGAHWHKVGPLSSPGASGFAGCPDAPSSFGLDRGAGKKRTAVKGRAAADPRDVYPLRRTFFARLEAGRFWASLVGRRQRAEERDRRGREGQTG